MTVDSSLAIQADGLAKSFRGSPALAGVDLRVRQGSIYGLLGPNGAGKTTTVRLLATLLRPDAGNAHILGYDVVREPEEVRRRISLTGQFASVDEDLTGRDNLILLGRLLGFRWSAARVRATELLDAFDLAEAAKRQVKTYSGGMRRRLDIAASVVRTPDLLFLDEPTTGLDPRSRGQVWQIVRALADSGTTVLLTTQYLEEADQLADRIAVVDRGTIIAEGTPTELKASVGRDVLRLTLRDAGQRETARDLIVGQLGRRVHLEADQRVLAVQLSGSDEALPILDAMARAGLRADEFALGTPSLDEVFFALTGHPAEPADGESEESALEAHR
ncbi:MAG: daunorubicin/doxorubicin resistance ABC transporter ATP-binding protein DrrA [Rhodospirillaceae bacterium]|nr:daunorubicin/doxorubicin resistance ABC transporter ATP-binding protein DrrA [Rhodospirillaceae bacterium]